MTGRSCKHIVVLIAIAIILFLLQSAVPINPYCMVILEEGNKLEIHNWQHDMNMYYKYKYGSFPPENKKGW